MLTVTEALKRRTSTREFRAQPLEEQLVREILDVARWAPSGGNLQPWKVIAVAGAERAAVTELARRVHAAEGPDESTARPVRPQLRDVRRSGRALLHHRRTDGSWAVGASWHVHAVGRPRGIGTRRELMHARGLGGFTVELEKTLCARRARSRLLRNGAGLCRRNRCGQLAALGSRAGGGVRKLPRIRVGPPCRPSPEANAVAPACASPEANVSKPRLISFCIAIDSSNPHCSMAESRSFLRQVCGNDAICRASSTAAGNAWPAGTNRFASPIASASCARTSRPVRIKSIARPCPIRRGRRMVPRSNSGTPNRRQKIPNVAVSDITRMSHHNASSQPPATA